MKPFFSIIIPTRTINDYIRHETLPGLLMQTYNHFECIVVVDKSDKEHQFLMKHYPFLKIIHDDIHTKPGEKRDLAAARSDAEILAFIDDDVFPPSKWLKNAYTLFTENPDMVALGGPGILPHDATVVEQMEDAVLKTWVGSGAYTYRFVAKEPREVDDYPTMNLMIRRSAFISVGGFDNKHWPGEDSKLLNKLVNSNRKIYYHPDVSVYHHRRISILGHLEQHKNYGKTRGQFAAEGDKNSSSPMYIIPSIFLLYLIGLIFLLVKHPVLAVFASLPVLGYLSLLGYVFFNTFLEKGNIMIALGASCLVPMTHITYGSWFIYGYIRQKITSLI